MKIHHIGLVVDSIEDRLPLFTGAFGLERTSDIVLDPEHEARLVLLGDGSGPVRIELIEAASDSSPVARSAGQGGGLAHICYEVDELEGEISRLRSEGALIVKEPTPAVLFDGRRVAFLYTKGHGVIELLEAEA